MSKICRTFAAENGYDYEKESIHTAESSGDGNACRNFDGI